MEKCKICGMKQNLNYPFGKKSKPRVTHHCKQEDIQRMNEIRREMGRMLAKAHNK